MPLVEAPQDLGPVAQIPEAEPPAPELGSRDTYDDAKKKLWQSMVLPDAVREAKDRNIALTDHPDVQDAAQHLGIRPDVFARDWPSYVNQSADERSEFQAQQRERIRANSGPQGPTAFDVMAAAERSSNLLGSLYQRINAPAPDTKAVPGFDPLASVPAGYESYADRFLDADSPEQVTWIKNRIDDERNDQQTIARAGKWGVAASMAAGLTDPVTVASMALPGAGETRLAQAGRMALIAGSTTAAQEGLMHELSVTRTPQESALNVAGSTVLGGVLGAVIRPQVPRGIANRTAANLTRELHDPASPAGRVLGPAERTVLDHPLPSDFEGPVPPGVNPQEMRVQPIHVPPAPEGPTRPSPGKIPAVEPERMSLLEAAAVTRGAGAETHGINFDEAVEQGLDPADLKAARFGSRPVFTKGGASFDAMAESLSQHGYPVTDESGRYDPNALLDALDLELRGRKQYSPAAADYVAALEMRDRAQMAAARAAPEAQLESELERDAAMAAERESVRSEAQGAQEGYHVGEHELTEEQRAQFEALARSGAESASQGAGRTAAGGSPAADWREATRIRRKGAADVLPVYRGGEREVGPEHFSEAALGAKTGHPSSGLGVFFTTSKEEASRWGRVSEAHLDIRNPKIIPADRLPGFDSAEEARAYAQQLEAQGHDGIVIRNKPFGGHDWVVAFHPEQVIHGAPEAAAELHVPEPVTSEEHINPGTESTTGAAAVARPGMEGESIARGARTIAGGVIGKVAPGLRVLTSDSLEARRLVQELATTPEALEKNRAGIATPQPVERKLWKYEGTWWQGLKARADQFRAYRERMAGAEDPAMSRAQFGREVAYAMRRGDVHEVPEVAQAAKDTRRLVFDPLKERAQKLGLLPDDIKLTGADSYLTRQYDARAIRQNLPKWLDTLTEGFKAQGVDPAEARDIAHKVTRNVLGSERGTMDWHVMDEIVPQSGRLKERTLKLPDTLLEPYLTSDIDHLSHSYLRSMAPEVEMTERFGTRDMKDQLDNVRDEYARLMEQAKARGEDPAPLLKQQDNVIRDLEAIRDRLYGLYGAPKDPGAFMVRAARMLRADNALRLLGAATLAHFPDLANVIARYGMPKTFGAIGRVLSSSAALNLTRNEAKRMGAALDMTMNMVASILGDYGSHSQFAEQRAMAKVTRAFTIVSGETPLITAVQALTSTLAQDELLRAAEKVAGGGELSASQTTRLASAGIDRDMLERFAKQGEFHREVNGLKFGMTDQWTDQEAAAAFESAVLKEAHGVTLRPGAGDTPLFMSSELGKTILQFKTFAFAANRIVVNPLLQGIARGDLNAVQGLFALAFMGTASYVAKQKAAGQPLELNKPGRLAEEVLDKSNLLGWTGEAIFPALWQLGMKDLSRWSDRDATETLLGPTAGTVMSAYERRFPARITANPEEPREGEEEKPFNRSDLHFLRRLMPGQNLWYFRRGVNALEDAVGDAFDLPGQSDKQREEKLAQNP